MDHGDGVAERPSPVAGNGLFATKSFASGDVLTSKGQATVSTLSDDMLTQCCSWCFLNHDFFVVCPGGFSYKGLSFCKGCSVVKYCSKECQSKDWKDTHKFECKQFKASTYPEGAASRLATRLVRGLAAGNQECEALAKRQSHLSLVKHTQKDKYETFSTEASRIWEAAGRPSNIDLETVTNVVALIFCNSTTMSSPAWGRIGDVSDSTLCVANHRCEPNAIVTFESRSWTLRALAPIQNGEEVFLCYAEEDDLFARRQPMLRNTHFFTCKCVRCNLGTSAPQEKFLRPANLMNAEGKTFGDSLIQQLSTDPSLSLHHLGDSVDERRLAVIQAYGTKAILQSRLLPDDQKRSSVLNAIGICELTGIWPSTRQPLAGLYARYLRYCITPKHLAQAVLAGIKLFFEIDPSLYPALYHPMKTVHAFNLYTVVKGVQKKKEPICAELDAHGIFPEILANGLTMRLEGWFRQTHGEDSQMGKLVQKMYLEMCMYATQVIEHTGWTRDEWWRNNAEKVDRVWTKAEGVCQKIKATQDGLVLPRPE